MPRRSRLSRILPRIVFIFVPLDVTQVGREIPFVYDVSGAAKDAKKDPRTTYATWIGLGLQALREQDFNVAADCFKAALVRTNDVPDVLRHLHARALLLDEQPREAESVWTALCAKNSEDVEARWQLAYSLFLRGESKSALAHSGRNCASRPLRILSLS